MAQSFTNSIPLVSLMKVDDVFEYMRNKAKVGVNFTGCDFYASIEKVKPYQEIPQDAKLVKVADLAKIMTPKGLKEMECEVVQLVDEARWYFKISDELK